MALCLICDRKDLFHDQSPSLGVNTLNSSDKKKSLVPEVYVIKVALHGILSILGHLELTLEWNSLILFSVAQKIVSVYIEARRKLFKKSHHSIFILDYTLSPFSVSLSCHPFKTILQRSRTLHFWGSFRYVHLVRVN